MNNRVPMRRTGFKRKVSAWASAPRAERVYRTPTLADPAAFRAPQPIATCCTAVLKELPVRSEAYRRAVANLPCAYCGIEGYSQHAHENEGKGARMKLDDRRAMPLCCARPGIEGCHAAFDQYRLIPGGREAHIALGRALAAMTRAHLNSMGLWPAGIPQYHEEAA